MKRRRVRNIWLVARSTIRVTIARPMAHGYRMSEADGTVLERVKDRDRIKHVGCDMTLPYTCQGGISGSRDGQVKSIQGEIAGLMEIMVPLIKY